MNIAKRASNGIAIYFISFEIVRGR